ncbi:hypothetical protein AAZX31_06G159900 [Glycine max]
MKVECIFKSVLSDFRHHQHLFKLQFPLVRQY